MKLLHYGSRITEWFHCENMCFEYSLWSCSETRFPLVSSNRTFVEISWLRRNLLSDRFARLKREDRKQRFENVRELIKDLWSVGSERPDLRAGLVRCIFHALSVRLSVRPGDPASVSRRQSCQPVRPPRKPWKIKQESGVSICLESSHSRNVEGLNISQNTLMRC